MNLLPLASARKPTLLVVGCGDVGMRVLKLLRGRWHLLALTSSPGRVAELRAAGATPLLGDLDDAGSLARLAHLADAVIHLAPPLSSGEGDLRTARLLSTLARGGRVRRLVYASTTGVYGDCDGARFDESRPVKPATARARRRVHAETLVRAFGRASGARVTVLRVPGIYASDRPGGHPRERLARGTPVLRLEDDVYTNHIHADDLARVCVASLYRGLPQRVVHASDDSELLMSEYFDLAADLAGVPRPTRISRADATRVIGEMALSFMSESRRLRNHRLKQELRVRLRYPTVVEGLTSG